MAKKGRDDESEGGKWKEGGVERGIGEGGYEGEWKGVEDGRKEM